MPMDAIVLATGNEHKVRELREIFGAQGLEVVGLNELGDGWEEPREEMKAGGTFLGNATIKAVSYAQQTGRLCVADDSGLEVDALGGEPGVMSSHYCTDGREEGMGRDERDRKNIEKLLYELGPLEKERRTARFVCVMVLADPSGNVRAHTRGTMEGRIGVKGDVPKGEGGFGYDPVFVVDGDKRGRTSAELSADEKHAVSHRGKAAREMAELLGGHGG